MIDFGHTISLLSAKHLRETPGACSVVFSHWRGRTLTSDRANLMHHLFRANSHLLPSSFKKRNSFDLWVKIPIGRRVRPEVTLIYSIDLLVKAWLHVGKNLTAHGCIAYAILTSWIKYFCSIKTIG